MINALDGNVCMWQHRAIHLGFTRESLREQAPEGCGKQAALTLGKISHTHTYPNTEHFVLLNYNQTKTYIINPT